MHFMAVPVYCTVTHLISEIVHALLRSLQLSTALPAYSCYPPLFLPNALHTYMRIPTVRRLAQQQDEGASLPLACVRETFEETGILPFKLPSDVYDRAMALRPLVHAQPSAFADLVAV